MPLTKEEAKHIEKQIQERVEHLDSAPTTKLALKAIANRITLLFLVVSALLSVIWYETRATRNIAFDNSIAIARIEGAKSALIDPLAFSLNSNYKYE